MDLYEFIDKLDEMSACEVASAMMDSLGPGQSHTLFWAFEILVDMIKNGLKDD